MKRHRYNRLLHTIHDVNTKCDRILCILDVMRREGTDSFYDSIRESARDMYLCSLEERRRTGGFFSITKHD